MIFICVLTKKCETSADSQDVADIDNKYRWISCQNKFKDSKNKNAKSFLLKYNDNSFHIRGLMFTKKARTGNY